MAVSRARSKGSVKYRRLVIYIGPLVELICLAGRICIPRRPFLSAVLLDTGYLGGATATQVRIRIRGLSFRLWLGVVPNVGGTVSAQWALTLRRIGVLLCVLLLIVVAFVILRSSDKPSAKLHNPDLEYLKAVNSVAPPKDPELLFILMTEFANSNLQDEGAEFFSARLKEFEPQLTPVQKSLYLGIIGLLRAQHASSVPLLKRYGYVKDTIAMLDQAKQLSGGKVFVVNWIAGVVHTSFQTASISERQRRRNSPGVSKTLTKRRIRRGCAKSIIISANSR